MTTLRTGLYSEGSLTRHILTLAVPTLLADFVNVLYSTVDRAFIGHMEGDGTLALSGVGVVFPLISFISAFATFFSSGATPIAAIERGKGDDEKAGLIMNTAFTMALITGVVLTVLLYIFRTPLLYLMGAEESTIGYAVDYFSIYVLGTVFVLISVGFNSFITMQGHGTVGMMTVIIGAVINTVLDPVFIFVFGMGVKGAAVATVISQAASSLYVVLFLRSRKSALKLDRLILDRAVILRILKLGVSGFMFKMTNSLTQAASNMTLRLYGGALSTLYIGAMSIINSLREMVSLPISAVTQSSQSVMGFNYGARKSDRVCSTIRIMTVMSLSYAVLSWAFVMAFPGVLISVFTPDEGLVSVTVPVMRIYFAVFFMMTFQSSGQTTFVGLNHPKSAVFFSLLRKVFLVLPLIILLPRLGLGVYGVFYAEALSQLIGASACYLTMFFTVYRPLKKGTYDYEKYSK